MVKRQRTPHFITGLGDGHVGRENSNQQGGQRAGLRHPGLANNKIHPAAAADDIFQVTKHTRRNNNNPNQYRLRPTKNEREVRMEIEDGRESRWEMFFTSSSADGSNKESFANPMRSTEQWQMSAVALVGMIVFLSALFLHLVSDSASSSGSGSSHHSSHNNSKFPRRNRIGATKRNTSGTTRKKKFDEWSSDEEGSEVDADTMSDGQASTSTPNGAPNGSSAKTALFYPYQPRHRKPSANGYKETYAGTSYSPSGATASSTAGFHSRNYYLAPMDGPVMMPSYQTPSNPSLKVRLTNPQVAHQNSPAQPPHQTIPVQQPNQLHSDHINNVNNTVNASTVGSSKSPAQPQRGLVTALDRQFVATGLESFQSDPPPSDPQQELSEQPQNTVMENDEESQHPPLNSEISNMSPLSSSHYPSEAPASAVNSPAAIFRHQGSYTNTSNNYQAYGEMNWDNTDNNRDSGSNMLNDSTHHATNRTSPQGTRIYHRDSLTSNVSSVGMSPRVDIDITDLETPRAGLTRRTVVDVMHRKPQADGTPMAKNSMSGLQSRLNAPTDARGDPNDPFYALRLPSANSMGMSPPQPLRQSAESGLNIPFATGNQESPLRRANNPQDEAIPLLPKLDQTGSRNRGSTGPPSMSAPRSIAVDELRLQQMEYGSAPQWQVRDPSPANIHRPQVEVSSQNEKATPPVLGTSTDLFTNTSLSSGSDYVDDAALETNEARKSIKHKRPNMTDFTDAASSLQSTIKFKELDLQEVIGGGGFGQVWRAIWRGTPVAVKVLTGSAQAKHVSKAILEEFAAEINLLSGMRHPNICLYMGACVDPPNRAIITELAANGSLWDALRLPLNPPFSASDGFSRDTWPGMLYYPGKHGTPPTSAGLMMPPVPPVGSWPWVLVKHVACGAARGMAYLHSGDPPILHRDLKSANILLNESYSAKVCDFGLSRLKAQERSMTGNCGTVQWMAPEVLANQRYNEKADVWSYGIILIELLSRECPYEGMSAIQCALAVLNRDQRPDIPKFCPPQLKALIKACVKKNPDERPTFVQIIMALDAMP